MFYVEKELSDDDVLSLLFITTTGFELLKKFILYIVKIFEPTKIKSTTNEIKIITITKTNFG